MLIYCKNKTDMPKYNRKKQSSKEIKVFISDYHKAKKAVLIPI